MLWWQCWWVIISNFRRYSYKHNMFIRNYVYTYITTKVMGQHLDSGNRRLIAIYMHMYCNTKNKDSIQCSTLRFRPCLKLYTVVRIVRIYSVHTYVYITPCMVDWIAKNICTWAPEDSVPFPSRGSDRYGRSLLPWTTHWGVLRA